jgi:hypothetical protein
LIAAYSLEIYILSSISNRDDLAVTVVAIGDYHVYTIILFNKNHRSSKNLRVSQIL